VSDIFGPIFVASQLEQAVVDIHEQWMETYIAELVLQIGWTGPDIPTPRSWVRRNHAEHFTRDQLPQMVVVSPGLAAPPVKDGRGVYRATWMIGVATIASAKDEQTTQDLAKFYAACSRALMIQHQSLGGIASNMIWMDESYDDIPSEEETSNVIAAGVNYFRIEVEGVADWRGGPRIPFNPPPPPDPINQPGSQDPIADTVSVTLQQEES